MARNSKKIVVVQWIVDHSMVKYNCWRTMMSHGVKTLKTSDSMISWMRVRARDEKCLLLPFTSISPIAKFFKVINLPNFPFGVFRSNKDTTILHLWLHRAIKPRTSSRLWRHTAKLELHLRRIPYTYGQGTHCEDQVGVE